jgi:hypothetical protein
MVVVPSAMSSSSRPTRPCPSPTPTGPGLAKSQQTGSPGASFPRRKTVSTKHYLHACKRAAILKGQQAIIIIPNPNASGTHSHDSWIKSEQEEYIMTDAKQKQCSVHARFRLIQWFYSKRVFQIQMLKEHGKEQQLRVKQANSNQYSKSKY